MRFTVLCLVLLKFATAALPPSDFIPEENPAVIFDAKHPPAPGSDADISRRQFLPSEVSQTTDPVSLWFDVGPTYYDVVQRKVADCWLSASAIAVVLASPDWMAHLFYNADNTPVHPSINPTVADTQVVLWDPASRKTHAFKATTYNQSKSEDRPGQRWWNSAIMQGVVQLGAITHFEGVLGDTATLDPTGGFARLALTALTGYEAVEKDRDYYDTAKGGVGLDGLFDDLSNAWSYRTPIVMSTKSVSDKKTDVAQKFPDSVLYGDHAYAVMWTVERTDGTRTVVLRNPWGMSLEAKLEDVFKTMKRVVHLKEFRQLDWARAIEGQGAGTVVKDGKDDKKAASRRRGMPRRAPRSWGLASNEARSEGV